VLRHGGTAAFWVHCFVPNGAITTDSRISLVQVYSEFRLGRFPSLTPLITDYAQGKDPATSLGPHWQRPGRTVLEEHLVKVPKATDVMPDSFTDWQHTFFTGMLSYFPDMVISTKAYWLTGTHYPELPNPQPVILHKRMHWDDLLAYFRTFSSLYTFRERNPEDANHPDGDVALRFWRTLRERVRDEGSSEEFVDVEWPLALVMVSRT